MRHGRIHVEPNRMTWRVQGVQGVVFDASNRMPVASAYEAFRKVATIEPAGTNTQPGMSQAFGAFRNGQLTVMLQPNRADFTMRPSEEGGEGGPPTFDDADAAIDAVRFALADYIADHNPARLGLVVNLSEGFDHIEDATRRFSEVTQIAVPEGAVDLTFGLNLKRKFGHAGWEMNRLLRWTTSTLFFLQFDANQIVSPPQQPQVIKQLTNMVVDVNTTPRPIPLGSTQALGALDDLIVEAKALMEKGYRHLVDA